MYNPVTKYPLHIIVFHLIHLTYISIVLQTLFNMNDPKIIVFIVIFTCNECYQWHPSPSPTPTDYTSTIQSTFFISMNQVYTILKVVWVNNIVKGANDLIFLFVTVITCMYGFFVSIYLARFFQIICSLNNVQLASTSIHLFYLWKFELSLLS